jgi:hypothetical protein
MGPGHTAADSVGDDQQETSEDGNHAEADRDAKPGAGRLPWTGEGSHLLDGIAPGDMLQRL